MILCVGVQLHIDSLCGDAITYRFLMGGGHYIWIPYVGRALHNGSLCGDAITYIYIYSYILLVWIPMYIHI